MRSGAKLTDPSASRIVTSTVRAGSEGSPGVSAGKFLCLFPGSPVPAQAKVGSSANPNIAIIRIVAPLFMLHLHTGHRARRPPASVLSGAYPAQVAEPAPRRRRPSLRAQRYLEDARTSP